jgi:hypothetical protein
MMNAQENRFSLSASHLTNTTCRRGRDISCGPRPILKMIAGTQYSLLGAELCCTSPRLGGQGTPRRSHQGSACLPTLPFHVSYPTHTLAEFHNCFHCRLINYPEDNSNQPYEFHLKSAKESQPSSNKKLSSSSSVAELQSSHCSSTSSVAKLQLSSQYNGRSNDSSNPHSPGLKIGKAIGQAIGHHQTATSTAQATT